jgi:hypothetical protein
VALVAVLLASVTASTIADSSPAAAESEWCAEHTLEPHRYGQVSYIVVPIYVCWGTDYEGFGFVTGHEHGYQSFGVRMKIRLRTSTGWNGLQQMGIGFGSGDYNDYLSSRRAGDFDYGELSICNGSACERLVLLSDGTSFIAYA